MESNMSDDLKKRGPQDASRINVNEEWELRHWTAKFGVTADELKEAVKKVGVTVDAVSAHFGSRA
jgi:diaminopimelate decarboxylase